MDDSSIDLNSDIGERFGQWSLGVDEALLEAITSANVACGFHADDPTIMGRVCVLLRWSQSSSQRPFHTEVSDDQVPVQQEPRPRPSAVSFRSSP